MRWWRAGWWALALWLPLASAQAAGRIVSLNLCTDQMLVLLAPEKAVGLSPLARDPALSFVAPAATALPVVRASAEAVLRLKPDLILATPYGAQTTLAVLEQEGIPVARVPLPQDFPGIRRMTSDLGQMLGAEERAATLLAVMDAQLAALRPLGRIRAIAWQARGYTAGPGTLMDAVLRAAGMINAASGRHLSLEALVRTPPDLLVVADAPTWPSLATSLLDHPALVGIERRTLSPALTICAGPFSAQAAVLLAR